MQNNLGKLLGLTVAKRTPPGVPVDEALKVLVEKHDIVKGMFHGFNYSDYFITDPAKRLSALSGGVNHILSLEEGRKRYLDAMAPLNRAAALAIHLEGARHLRDDIGYFQSVEKISGNILLVEVGKEGLEEEWMKQFVKLYLMQLLLMM